MPVATGTLKGDFNALLGEPTQLHATIEINSLDGNWVNDTDLKILLGGATLAVGADGKFVTGLLPLSTGTDLQYRVAASYVDPAKTRRPGRAKEKQYFDSGWFRLEAAESDLAERAMNSELRITKTAAEQILDLIYGITEHGDISGDVTFAGPKPSHRFNAAGPTTITLAGYEEGMVATLICFDGADNVTIAGLPDVELVDGTAWTAELAHDVWVTGGGGGGTPAVPDTTPPTAVTDLAAAPGSDGHSVTLTFSAATDAESTVKYRARVYPTGGTAPAWPTSGPLFGITGSPVVVTGLNGGTAYTAELHAYSNGGASATDSATFTTPAALTTVLTDTFTGSGNLSTHTADTGQSWAGSTAGTSLTANRLTTATGNVRSTHGSQCREATFDVYFTASDLIQVFPWDGETGSSGGTGPRGFLNQNGQVSLNSLSAVTYNIAGGTDNYTPVGTVDLDLNTSHAVKMTYDGTLCALFVNGVKVIEGTPAAALDGTKVAVNTGSSAFIDNLNIKAIA